ncbi:MAG TPA: bifunctional precorrin-2 dehydrogenase/sirohydrochlorin ferrochelatase [Acidimicrobiales bacterium]|jgi:siroheme synthase-like protein|nr:bifunctional precorrin-2 dehydrogenase/sirohydrochlorin ferrochelatase [Acidimicrobiales bacterium]
MTPSTATEVAPAPTGLAGPPLFQLALRLDGEKCLVVGGGPVAARKASALLECGAAVTVVAPSVCPAMAELPVLIDRRPYVPGEAAAYRLVITATGKPVVDRTVFVDAEQAGVLVNAADDPGSCSFFMPAVMRRGPVQVAVSTGGASPFVAGWVRDRLAGCLPPAVERLAGLIGGVRSEVRSAGVPTEGLDWAGLAAAAWPLLESGDIDGGQAAAQRWLAGVLD